MFLALARRNKQSLFTQSTSVQKIFSLLYLKFIEMVITIFFLCNAFVQIVVQFEYYFLNIIFSVKHMKLTSLFIKHPLTSARIK